MGLTALFLNRSRHRGNLKSRPTVPFFFYLLLSFAFFLKVILALLHCRNASAAEQKYADDARRQKESDATEAPETQAKALPERATLAVREFDLTRHRGRSLGLGVICFVRSSCRCQDPVSDEGL